jgi:hypothetical protein
MVIDSANARARVGARLGASKPSGHSMQESATVTLVRVSLPFFEVSV